MENVQAEKSQSEKAPNPPVDHAHEPEKKEPSLDDLRARAIADFLPDRAKKLPDANPSEKEVASKEGDEKPSEKVEPKAEEKKSEKPQVNLAAKLGSLAKKERELRQKETQQKQTQARLKELEDIIQNARTNPKALLDLAKISEEDYANYLLKGPDSGPQEKVEFARLGDEVKALKETVANVEREKREMAERQAEASFRNDLKSFSDSNKDRFPTVSVENGGTELAFEIVKAYYQETGDIPRTANGDLDLELVFDKAEEHLRAQALERAKAYKSLPYLKDIFGEVSAPAKAESVPSQAARSTKTLTNTPPVATPKAQKAPVFKDDRERLQWAASLIKDI